MHQSHDDKDGFRMEQMSNGSVQVKATSVETATLVLPNDALRRGDEFVLQTTSEIAAATTDVTQGQQIHIEGIVDLDKLHDLVIWIDQDEFESLLHHTRHQDDDEEEDNTTFLSTLFQHDDEETRLLGDLESEQEKLEDVPVAADAFLDTLVNTLPPTATANKTQTFETSNQAFLLSVPLPATATDSLDEQEECQQALVLALPEVPETEPVVTEETEIPSGADADDENDDHDDDYDGFVGLVRQYSEYLPHIPTLPTDVHDVELVAHTEPVSSSMRSGTDKQEENITTTHLDLIVERQVPLIGYVILVVGLFALASVGAALDLQTGNITPTIKTYWRLQATAIFLFPLAVVSLAQTPKEKLEEQWSSLTRRDLFIRLPVCAASYAFMTTSFVIALELTSLANAFILSNLASLLIICGKFFLGIKILLLEGTGAFVGLSGAVVCALAPTAVEATVRLLLSEPSFTSHEQVGDFIAFLASIGTASYLILAKMLRHKMDLFLFMFLIFSLASIKLMCYMITKGEEVQLSMDPNVGIFGWMNLVPDRLPLELYMVIVCNIAGTTGYIAVMKYFEPVVISMVMLTEPAIATVLGVFAGVATIPGMQVIIGNSFVILGSTIVIASESRKNESFDATKALKTVEDTKTPAVVQSPHINALRKSTGTAKAESPTKIIWKPS